MNDAAAAELVFTLMEEVRSGAGACGKLIEPEFTTQLMVQTKNMVPYDSSMRLDYRARRPMELEAIYAKPLAAAECMSPMRKASIDRSEPTIPQREMRNLHALSF